MRKFDTKVQDLKYNVLKEVARQAFNGTLQENLLDIPKIIVPATSLPCAAAYIRKGLFCPKDVSWPWAGTRIMKM